jgi:hypothetical protein
MAAGHRTVIPTLVRCSILTANFFWVHTSSGDPAIATYSLYSLVPASLFFIMAEMTEPVVLVAEFKRQIAGKWGTFIR